MDIAVRKSLGTALLGENIVVFVVTEHKVIDGGSSMLRLSTLRCSEEGRSFASESRQADVLGGMNQDAGGIPPLQGSNGVDSWEEL